MSIQSLIDKPKQLLDLINDCLKPKDIEKKKFGEVLGKYIVKPVGAPTLVPESDPRKPYADAASDFR